MIRSSQDSVSQLIVALDVGSRREALDLVGALKGLAGMFKVGNEAFIAEGPGLVRDIVDTGSRVFLDLKLHDIPNTVSRAALRAADLGASMLTVHAAGGPAMIDATRVALEKSHGADRPIIVAVTVLTSIDQETMSQVGIAGTLDAQVLRLARMACGAGADGIVCSPREVRQVRRDLKRDFKIVTPGVRMPSQSADDQRRVATPRDALDSGADFIVIGRYVNQARDPAAALSEVVDSIR